MCAVCRVVDLLKEIILSQSTALTEALPTRPYSVVLLVGAAFIGFSLERFYSKEVSQETISFGSGEILKARGDFRGEWEEKLVTSISFKSKSRLRQSAMMFPDPGIHWGWIQAPAFIIIVATVDAASKWAGCSDSLNLFLQSHVVANVLSLSHREHYICSSWSIHGPTRDARSSRRLMGARFLKSVGIFQCQAWPARMYPPKPILHASAL